MEDSIPTVIACEPLPLSTCTRGRVQEDAYFGLPCVCCWKPAGYGCRLAWLCSNADMFVPLGGGGGTVMPRHVRTFCRPAALRQIWTLHKKSCRYCGERVNKLWSTCTRLCASWRRRPTRRRPGSPQLQVARCTGYGFAPDTPPSLLQTTSINQLVTRKPRHWTPVFLSKVAEGQRSFPAVPIFDQMKSVFGAMAARGFCTSSLAKTSTIFQLVNDWTPLPCMPSQERTGGVGGMIP